MMTVKRKVEPSTLAIHSSRLSRTDQADKVSSHLFFWLPLNLNTHPLACGVIRQDQRKPSNISIVLKSVTTITPSSLLSGFRDTEQDNWFREPGGLGLIEVLQSKNNKSPLSGSRTSLFFSLCVVVFCRRKQCESSFAVAV